jgi:hypothetical protein
MDFQTSNYDIGWDEPRVFPHDLHIDEFILSMAGVVEVVAEPVLYPDGRAMVATRVIEAITDILPVGSTYHVQRNRHGSPDLCRAYPKEVGA